MLSLHLLSQFRILLHGLLKKIFNTNQPFSLPYQSMAKQLSLTDSGVLMFPRQSGWFFMSYTFSCLTNHTSRLTRERIMRRFFQSTVSAGLTPRVFSQEGKIAHALETWREELNVMREDVKPQDYQSFDVAESDSVLQNTNEWLHCYWYAEVLERKTQIGHWLRICWIFYANHFHSLKISF